MRKGVYFMKAYGFHDKDNSTKKDTEKLEKWIKETKGGIVTNVEGDKTYQEIDVDLTHTYSPDGKFPITKLIEVKVDSFHKTGNFFFETISNTNTGSLGCFMYTKSDEIYYYYPEARELYIMPTNEVREWFKRNMNRYKKTSTSTKGYNNKVLYSTEGYLVPRQDVLKYTSTKLIKFTVKPPANYKCYL